MSTIYGADKVLAHFDRLAIIGQGRPVAPVHVQLIISDLCNQDCSFCLLGDTRIDTNYGSIPISEVTTEMSVVLPSGQLNKIEKVGSREVDHYYLVQIADFVVKCTGEHPFLTHGGWVKAKDLTLDHLVATKIIRHESQGGIMKEEARLKWLKNKNFGLQHVTFIGKINEKVTVYNLSSPPAEIYVANGVLVHNCAYRMEGYTSSELFKVIDGPNVIKNPARFIDTEKAKEIILDCANMGVKAIQFTGGGEPSVHKDCAELLRYTRDLGIQYSFVSNGVRWSDDLLDVLVDATWVRVSVDAGTEETYTKIRRVSAKHYHTALTNIKKLCDLKKERKSEVVIGFGYVVTEDNWSEVVTACRTAKALGVDNFRISAIFQPDGTSYFEDFHAKAKEHCLASELEATEAFKVFNMFGDRVEDLEQAHPSYHRCGYQFLTTYVGGDLNVYRCCNTSYNEQGLLGSLKDLPFRDFWFSKEVQDKMSGFNAQTCERCQFNNKNLVINKVLDRDFPHANFV